MGLNNSFLTLRRSYPHFIKFFQVLVCSFALSRTYFLFIFCHLEHLQVFCCRGGATKVANPFPPYLYYTTLLYMCPYRKFTKYMGTYLRIIPSCYMGTYMILYRHKEQGNPISTPLGLFKKQPGTSAEVVIDLFVRRLLYGSFVLTQNKMRAKIGCILK